MLLLKTIVSVGLVSRTLALADNNCTNLFGTSSCDGTINTDSFFTDNRADIPNSTVNPNRYIAIPFGNGRITNFVLSSDSSVNCTNIKFCLDIPSLSTSNCYVANVSQSTSFSCTVSMNNVFSNSTEAAIAESDNSMSIVVGATSLNPESFYLDIDQDDITDYTFSKDDRSNYFINTFNAIKHPSNADLVVIDEHITKAGCSSDPNAIWLVFKPSDPTCNVNMTISSGSGSEAVPFVLQKTIDRAFVERCAAISSKANNITINVMRATPHVHGDGCAFITDTGTQYATVSFNIITDADILVAVTNDLVMQGSNLVNSSYNYIGSDECDFHIHRMDKVAVTHTVQYIWSNQLVEPTVTASSTALYGDIPMTRTNLICSASIEANSFNFTTCTIVYTSDECQPMISTDSGTTCSFEFAFGKFTAAETWFTFVDGPNTLESSLQSLNSNPLTLYSGVCNQIESIVDVTSRTPVQLVPLSSDQNNIIEINMIGVNYDTSITMAIAEVRINATDMDGRSFIRTYNIRDKIRLMHDNTSAYYSDVHYCRFLDQPTNNALKTCDLPFYIKLKNETMHDSSFSLVNVGDTIVNNMNPGDRFLVDYQGHEACQDIRQRNTDRWAFNPSMWIFRDMKRNSIRTATARVTAILSNCTSPPGEPYTRLRRRMLATNNETTMVVETSVQIQLNLDDDNQTNPNVNVNDAVTNISIALIVVCSVLAFVILSSCCCVFVYMRNKKQREEKNIQNEDHQHK